MLNKVPYKQLSIFKQLYILLDCTYLLILYLNIKTYINISHDIKTTAIPYLCHQNNQGVSCCLRHWDTGTGTHHLDLVGFKVGSPWITFVHASPQMLDCIGSWEFDGCVHTLKLEHGSAATLSWFCVNAGLCFIGLLPLGVSLRYMWNSFRYGLRLDRFLYHYSYSTEICFVVELS